MTEHEDPDVVAVLRAVCSWHEEQTLAAWALFRDGQIRVIESGGWREENVRDAPGGPSHLREVVACPRAACRYEEPLADGIELIEQTLRRMGDLRMTSANIELNSFLRGGYGAS